MAQFPISVLLVEDEKILRTLYKKLFKNWVSDFYIAENGLEGLEMFKQFRPDLIITDIKMPVMNGLDMMVKIKKIDSKARVILISSYGDSHYFIRAIENGVKVFLQKPVDNERLYQLIEEQAHEILLEQSVHIEEQRRIKAETELFHNEQLLQAVNESAELLLQEGFNYSTINLILSKIGFASKACRAYIFENFEHNSLQFCRQTFEWVADGISPQIENTELSAIPHSEGFFTRWVKILSSKQSLFGNINEFTEDEQDILRPQNIESLIVAPIFVQKKWWGFIGIDECFKKREWKASEASTLMTAANIIGAAIHRSKIEIELKSLNSDLEERIYLRTHKLQSEVAERKMAEKLLRESEEKYRLIFENTNDAIFLSIDSKIMFINPKFYEVTGYYPNRLIGKSFLDIIHPDFKAIVQQNYERRLNYEFAPTNYDIQIIDAKGHNKWVELKANLIQWEDEWAILTFLTDIDTRKNFENQLQDLNTNLEERVNIELKQREAQQQLILQKSKLESLGELSAGMAHEINQPLGGLSMSLENILDELREGKLQDAYVQKKIDFMFGDIERIKKIIEHVRIFSREQNSNNYQPFELSLVIDNALLLVNRLLVDQSIDLKVILKATNQTLFGNPFRLEQVILNMISNASYAVDQKLKQNKDGFQKTIILKTISDEDEVSIEIEDNGIGIPEGIIENIFDPFFSTKDNKDGTGLGLSISYGIIRDHGGKIVVESNVGEFTKMKIILPVYKV